MPETCLNQTYLRSLLHAWVLETGHHRTYITVWLSILMRGRESTKLFWAESFWGFFRQMFLHRAGAMKHPSKCLYLQSVPRNERRPVLTIGCQIRDSDHLLGKLSAENFEHELQAVHSDRKGDGPAHSLAEDPLHVSTHVVAGSYLDIPWLANGTPCELFTKLVAHGDEPAPDSLVEENSEAWGLAWVGVLFRGAYNLKWRLPNWPRPIPSFLAAKPNSGSAPCGKVERLRRWGRQS